MIQFSLHRGHLAGRRIRLISWSSSIVTRSNPGSPRVNMEASATIRYGSNNNLPVVLRDSSSSWARFASVRG